MVDQLPPDISSHSQAPAPKEPVQPQQPLRPGIVLPNMSSPVAKTQKKNRKFLSKKYWVLALLLLVFGGGVGGFVPVSHIPGLSSLARAMGYSEEQMQEMSFLKTLFFWADDERGPAARLAARSYSVFSNRPGRFDAINRGASAYGATGEGSSTLIDVGALNASLRSQGKAGVAVAGAAQETGEDSYQKNVRFNKPITGLSEAARASSKAGAEVYYGVDANLAARVSKDGFDSSSGLNKINSNIVGSRETDWKQDLLNKAVLEQTSGLDKKLGGTNSSMMMLQNAGRSLTDFRYIWLTSQASNRARQVPLKKTLAAAGFFAEEMPQKIFSATGGIAMAGLEEDAVVADIELAEKQQQRQQECDESSRVLGPRINDTTRSVVSQINALQGTFPAFPGDCTNSSKVNAWRTTLAQVRNACSQVKRDYDTLGEKCLLDLKYNRSGQCTTNNLDDKLNEYERMCAEYLQDKSQTQAGEELDMSIYNPEQFSNEQVTETVHGTFNVPVWGGSSGSSTPNDFFPETDLSNSQGWSFAE